VGEFLDLPVGVALDTHMGASRYGHARSARRADDSNIHAMLLALACSLGLRGPARKRCFRGRSRRSRSTPTRSSCAASRASRSRDAKSATRSA